MVAVLVGAQVVVLVAMLGVSAWGWKHIDEGTRTRARVGPFGFDYTKSKNTTLIYAPLIGLIIVSSTLAVMDSDAPETIAALGLAIIVFFLAAHWATVRRAGR